MLGRRLNEYRNSFALPADIKLPNLYDEDLPSVMGEVAGETSGHDYGMSVAGVEGAVNLPDCEPYETTDDWQTPRSTGRPQSPGCAP